MTAKDLVLSAREIEVAPPEGGHRLYRLTAAYPRLEWGAVRAPTRQEARTLARINKYYIDLSADYAIRVGRAWRGVQRRRLAREGEDFVPRRFIQTVEVTLSERHLFVLTTRREIGQEGSRLDRFADCFDLATGHPATFDEVFSRPEAARLAADIEVAQQLARRAALPGSTLRKNAAKRAAKQPDPHGFWRTGRGSIVLLYPAGLLADAAEGPLRFAMPREWAEKYYGGKSPERGKEKVRDRQEPRAEEHTPRRLGEAVQGSKAAEL